MLTMTGVGRDAQAVAQVSRHLKNSLGWMAYLPAAIRKSFATPYQFTVSSAGEIPQNITAWSVLIANCPLVPLRVMAFPNAVLDDGLFDRLDVSVNRAWQWGAVAAKGLINCAATPAVLRYRQVKDLTIRTPCPLPVQVDGDIIEDVNQLQVVVSPGALRVRVPANEN
jgi:diacylglycerol kinase family enzyme